MPRYVKGRGSGKRLWEIEVTGPGYVVRYGKPGALEEFRREFDSEELARVAADRFIADRVKDGYRRIDNERPRAPAVAREPALEAAIRATPDDVAAYLVYADWLQQHGDVRGQLISMQAAAPTSAVREATLALLVEHGHSLLATLAESYEPRGRGPVTLTWRWGFVERARIEADRDRDLDAAALLEVLAELPVALVLRALAIGLPHVSGEVEYADVIDALLRVAPHLAPTLRELVVGDFVFPDETEISWAHVGDVSPLYAAYPALEALTVQGDVTRGRIAHDRLRSFEVRTGGLGAADVAALVSAHWPALQRLVVWFGDEEYGAGGTAEDVERLLDRLPPGVVHLGLCNAAFTDDIVDQLAAWPRLHQLHALDLSKGTLTDDGARRLAALADRLASLATLDVSENLLGPAGVAVLARLPAQVTAADQRELDDGERYPAVGE